MIAFRALVKKKVVQITLPCVNRVEVIGHRLPDVTQELLLVGCLESRVELDRPPLDFLDDWFGEFGGSVGGFGLCMSKGA